MLVSNQDVAGSFGDGDGRYGEGAKPAVTPGTGALADRRLIAVAGSRRNAFRAADVGSIGARGRLE
jgi:hypothetical protein